MRRVLSYHRARLETPQPYRSGAILWTRCIEAAQRDIVLTHPLLWQGRQHLLETRWQAVLGVRGPTLLPGKGLAQMHTQPLAQNPHDLSWRIRNPEFSLKEFPHLGGGPRGLLVQQVV